MSAQAGKGKGHQSQRELVQIQSGNCQNVTYFDESTHIFENFLYAFGQYLIKNRKQIFNKWESKRFKYAQPISC